MSNDENAVFEYLSRGRVNLIHYTIDKVNDDNEAILQTKHRSPVDAKSLGFIANQVTNIIENRATQLELRLFGEPNNTTYDVGVEVFSGKVPHNGGFRVSEIRCSLVEFIEQISDAIGALQESVTPYALAEDIETVGA